MNAKQEMLSLPENKMQLTASVSELKHWFGADQMLLDIDFMIPSLLPNEFLCVGGENLWESIVLPKDYLIAWKGRETGWAGTNGEMLTQLSDSIFGNGTHIRTSIPLGVMASSTAKTNIGGAESEVRITACGYDSMTDDTHTTNGISFSILLRKKNVNEKTIAAVFDHIKKYFKARIPEINKHVDAVYEGWTIEKIKELRGGNKWWRPFGETTETPGSRRVRP